MMSRIGAWWAQGPSSRIIIAILGIAALALLVRWQIAATIFSREVGFIPFDLQGRLNQGMLVIQVGAARGHALGRLYGSFVMTDIPVSVAIAFATVVFWRWLHLRAPNAVYGFLTAGGITLLPVAVAIVEMIEHRAIFALLQQRGRDGYADAVGLAITIHNGKLALAYLRDALTLVFIAITAVLALKRRGTRAPPG